jgi:plasmid stabilization system protein ParE
VTFEVRFTEQAGDDLRRLYEHLLERATTVEDFAQADRALAAVASALDNLQRSPFIYRKAGAGPFLREMIIPFGGSGYLALFEVEDANTVTVLAVRHQLEDDYH